jgi:hypothetical protein
MSLFERLRASVNSTGTASPVSAPRTLIDRLRDSVLAPTNPLLSDEPPSIREGVTISEREQRRRVKGLVDGVVGMSATPEDLSAVIAGFTRSRLVSQFLGGSEQPEKSVNDQIVEHLSKVATRDAANSDNSLRKVLSNAMVGSDLPVRAVSRAFNISRYQLTPNQPEPRSTDGNSRELSKAENDYITSWIRRRLVALKDRRQNATRKVDGRVEHKQWEEDFIGKVATAECFRHEHRDNPRFCNLSRSKISSLYPWNSRDGTTKTCICVTHLQGKMAWADYARIAPQLHHAYASQFAQLPPQVRRSDISCQACASHPFNAPTTAEGVVRKRQTMSNSAVVRALQCVDASTPGAKASPLCAGLVDGKICEACGWDNKVPKCLAESEAPGLFTWRVVEQQKLSGHTHNVVVHTKGSSKEFLQFIRNVYSRLAPHHFLTYWQSWAETEIVRRMPTCHFSVLSDYIMKYEFGKGHQDQFQSDHFVHRTTTILILSVKTVSGASGPHRLVTNHCYTFLTEQKVPQTVHC